MTTTPEYIADLTKAHSDAHQDLLNLSKAHSDAKQDLLKFSNTLNSRVAAKEQAVDKAISDLTVLGDGGMGSTVINAASFFTGEKGSCYLHFKLPLKADINYDMIHLHIRGYAYGEAKIIDATLVGYCYKPRDNVINVETQGTHQPTLYKGSDKTIYARLYFPNCYFLTVTVDTTKVGNGKLFRRGDIEIIKSSQSTL